MESIAKRGMGALLLTLLAGAPAWAADGAGKSSAEADRAPAVGDAAPDFALTTLDGATIRLSELIRQGPVVLVELRGWVGYQCPVCSRQVGDLVAHAAEFRKAGARVVLVYPGPKEQVGDRAREFMRATELPDGFTFVTDPDMAFTGFWGLRWAADGENAYPATFVIDPAGKVRYAEISHSHGGRASAEDVLRVLADPAVQSLPKQPVAQRQWLDALKAQFMRVAPAERVALYERGIQDVAHSGVMEKAKRVGEPAPDFDLPDARGRHVRLSDALRDHPIVLTWYRGGWCPYCNI
ncbi:MAG TPA: redoxin domain-containing protein, partial [Phycisphaerae bacterium]|nr:redoxin domain-containing protein [Phycisphaerae bacterium]